MSAPAPRLFTIPAGEPFLRVLARAVLAGGFPGDGLPAPDPLALSSYTILVPTRRAARALAEAFLDASDGRALLLPRIRPIGDVDEDDLLLSGPGPAAAEAELAPAMPALERRLLLAREIMDGASSAPSATSSAPMTPAQALALAGELGSLIDSFETEDVEIDRISSLVADEFAHHWAETLDFLKIITVRLPQLMAERGVIGAAGRRNRLIDAEAARMAAGPVGGPVIAAGSTGSIPATARLLAAIARLDHGAVVLPGLDLGLDDASWRLLRADGAADPGHPQFGMKLLLDGIGADRGEVQVLSGADAGSAARFRLFAEALRPAETTDTWAGSAPDLAVLGPQALDGLTVIEAPSPREEAAAAALVLRRALDVPGRTAALVTPDRGLARRVAAELARWGIGADDSAGVPLRRTPAGMLAMAILEAVADDLAPVPLLSLLKHPLATFGLESGVARAHARRLELAALRGVRPSSGIGGLREAVAATRRRRLEGRRMHKAIRRIDDWPGLDDFISRIEQALAPLLAAFSNAGEADLAALVEAHTRAVEAVAAPAAGGDGAAVLWTGEAGEALAGFLADLLDQAPAAPRLDARDYPAALATLLDGVVVRPRAARHPRISILGLLEARLVDADIMVLGGLNEGVWPPTATVDAWLNRPMRAALGLQPPERRIGLAAHDFVQAACAPRVYLTRTQKADGAPTVPSRWLLRLDALLDGMNLGARLRPQPDEDWLAWVQGLDDDGRPAAPVAMPRPAPPVEARPRRLSVTRIEALIRDPYAIFARSVLGFEQLEPLDADPGAADRGTMVHDALHLFLRDHPGTLGEDALARLLAIGEQVFAGLIERPGVAAFWWPRFRKAAAWFIEQEADLRRNAVRQLTEIDGEIGIAGPAGPFTLTARADRIDMLDDGSLRICDYKTGKPPTDKQVAAGLAPQLPLEAVIAAGGGFQGVDAAPVSELVYLGLSGGEPAGEFRRLDGPPALAVQAGAGLARLVAHFDDPATVYRPRAVAEFERWAYDFDRLARHDEWSLQAAQAEGR